MKVRLLSKKVSQYFVYKDRWLGQQPGNCETREVAALVFEQLSRIEDPHIPKGLWASVEGWPNGQIELVADAAAALGWRLGGEYELAFLGRGSDGFTRPLWITAKVTVESGKEWELVGVFDSRSKAEAACKSWKYCIWPVQLNVEAPDETTIHPKAEYPIARTE
jgi:hypothetical protein